MPLANVQFGKKNLVFSSPFESCFNTPSPFLYKIHFYCPESQIVAVIGQHRCKGEIFARSESRCRYLHLAKNAPHKILRSSIFTSSRGQLGRPSMPSTHSDTHARTPLFPPPPKSKTTVFFSSTHLSALLEDVTVAGVLVARRPRLAVHVRDVCWSRVQLEI